MLTLRAAPVQEGQSRGRGRSERLPPPRDATGLLAFALGTLLPFTLLAAWARFASPAPWEPGILAAVAVGPGLAGDLVRAVNFAGNLPVWIALVAVLAAVAMTARQLIGAALIVLSLASDLVAFAVKLVVERARPETAAVEHFFGPDNFAFPSGHVVRAVALCAVLGWLLAPRAARLPVAGIAGLGAGVVMGYARVSLGVHWPTDALGGTLLGLGWFALSALVVSRWR